MMWRERLRTWIRARKRDVLALWLAARDARTPWYAKAVAAGVAAYALSPIDLIPDFIPVLGYVDDAVVVSLGVMLAVRLIPRELMEEFRARAAQMETRPVSRAAAVAVVVLWIGGAAWVAWMLRKLW